MARPGGRPVAAREGTIADLIEEFLDRCRAKNLSVRTIEWYEDRTRRFSDWCLESGNAPGGYQGRCVCGKSLLRLRGWC